MNLFRHKQFKIVIILLTLLMLPVGVIPAPIAWAADVTVTTTIDESDGSCGDGDCSLRDTINT